MKLISNSMARWVMEGNFKRHFLSPFIVLAFITLWELGSLWLGLPVSVAIAYAVMVFTIFRWGGLRSALASAAALSLYPLYHLDDYGPERAVLLIAGAFLIAVQSGALKRIIREQAIEGERQRLRADDNQAKADFVDNLNGNIEYLREINGDLIRLALAVEMMPKAGIVSRLNEIQDKTADLAQRAIGWHQLALDKRLVKGESD